MPDPQKMNLQGVSHLALVCSDMARTGVIPEDAPRHRDVPGEAAFRSVRLTDVRGNNTNQLYFGQPFRVHVACDVLKDIPDGHWEVSISTTDGTASGAR